MNKQQLAVDTFLNNFNCAQAIVSAFGPDLNLSRENSLKLATGLGAGLNYNGKTCGAVLGAFIILGLRYGINEASDQEGKQRVREKLDRYTQHFKKEFRSIECNDLLNADISNPEELPISMTVDWVRLYQ